MLTGFIDLHCHPIPSIDDGARSAADGGALLVALAKLGFVRVVATPHIRSGVWNNRRETIEPALALLEVELARLRAEGVTLPQLDVAAEHMFDDVTWELFVAKQAMTYPGGTAALVEFPYDSIPLRVEVRLWRLSRMGITPVLAHPERYAPLHKDSERLDELIGAGAQPLLDVMSLVGAYGQRAQMAAERILRENKYAAACTDAHKPSDAPIVADGMRALHGLVGEAGVARLFIAGPQRFLHGRNA